ncbi:MAG: pyridoxamine 5'-phosphate oxidase family protein [Micropepsaceae bacterium]
MTHSFSQLMFTPSVRAEQEAQGSRRAYERLDAPQADPRDTLGEAERAFIAARDSFYMASVSETGWPYVQHRGGPPGFLKCLDDRALGFADFRGNRQYVSVGNLKGNDRVSLILVDYPHQRRLKLIGHARQAGDPETLAMLQEGRLEDPAYAARVERGIVIAPRIARKSGRRFFDKAMRP